MIGITRPRRLITPFTNAGSCGTGVTFCILIISRTFSTPMAYASSSSTIVRYLPASEGVAVKPGDATVDMRTNKSFGPFPAKLRKISVNPAGGAAFGSGCNSEFNREFSARDCTRDYHQLLDR